MTSENRLRLIAAGVGIAPITLFLILAGRRERMVPVIISQKVVPNPNGPRLLEINFLPPLNIPKPDPDDEYDPVNYRIVDRMGRRYGGQISSMGPKPVSVRIETGYGRPPDHPRLEVYVDGHYKGSKDLPPFPEPVRRELSPETDPRITAAFGTRMVDVNDPFPAKPLKVQQSVIQFRPVAPIGPNEVWEVQLLETNLSPLPGGAAYLYAQNPVANVAATYSEDIRAVKIRIRRRERIISTEDITLPPLRFKKFGHQTDFDVPTDIKIPNHLGVEMILRRRPIYFSDPHPTDQFQAQLALDIPEIPDASPSNGKDYFGPIPITSDGLKDMATGELISPSIEKLGVQSVSVLGRFSTLPPTITSRLRNPMPNPMKGPIALQIRVKLLRWKLLDEFDTTIPVNKGKLAPITGALNPTDELRR